MTNETTSNTPVAGPFMVTATKPLFSNTALLPRLMAAHGVLCRDWPSASPLEQRAAHEMVLVTLGVSEEDARRIARGGA